MSLPDIGTKTTAAVTRLGATAWDIDLGNQEFLFQTLGADEFQSFEEDLQSDFKAYCEIDVDIKSKDRITVTAGYWQGVYNVDFVQNFPDVIPHRKLFITKTTS